MRNNKIDFIRALCSLTIIMAHVSAPNWVNNIRSFDVVVLVMISGMSLLYASKISYNIFLLKRIQKLFIPTILMLIAVFGGSFIICQILDINQLYSRSHVLRSFLLLHEGSIGYVWIVQIYLLIAILTPLIQNGVKKIKSFQKFLLANLISIGIALPVRLGFFSLPDSLIRIISIDWIYGGYVYTIIAFDGLWIVKNKEKFKLVTAVVAGLFFINTMVLSVRAKCMVFNPGSYKFPPQFYYCVYGLLVGLILYIIAPKNEIMFIKWISMHSFDIYLWHIILLHIFGVIVKIPILSKLDNYWILKYIVITGGSIAITALATDLIERFKKVK